MNSFPKFLLRILPILALTAPSLEAQSTDGISVPAVLVRQGTGPWFGYACPQPYGWYGPYPSGNVTSQGGATVRVGALGTGVMFIAISFSWGTHTQFAGLQGPLLLNPSAYGILEVANAVPLPPLPLGCYPSLGHEFTRTVPLPPGVDFAIQALVPDVGGTDMIFSAVTVVRVV